MTRTRVLLVAGALLMSSGALLGVHSSGATWSDSVAAPTAVSASKDWTAPTVAVADLAAGIFGVTTVTATATDARSDIASVTLQYAPAGSGTWTTLSTGCTSPSGPSPHTYSCSWDTTTIPDGDYEVRALTSDAATPTANTAVSAVEPVQVANSASVVLTHVPSAVRGAGVSLTATFLHPANGSAKLSIEYLAGSTWTQIGACFIQSATSLTCTWDTTTFANGPHDLRAKAVSGSTTVTDEQTGVVVDNVAPTLDSFTVPEGVLSGTVTLAAVGSDTHSSVASVRFEYRQQGAADWTLCATDTSAPFSCALNTNALDDNEPYDLRATATDAAGNVSAPLTVSRTINNVPGSVSITYPGTGSTVAGQVAVAVNASSERGVASVRVDFRPAGGTFSTVCTDTTAPHGCTWDTTVLVGGAYELRAVMTETYGGATATSATVSVSVDNSAPGTVSITSPAAGSTVSGTVTVAATAKAPNGVTSVRIQARPAGGAFTEICTDTTAPYSCSWNTAAIAYGAHELQAVLTQGNGVQVTGTSVLVEVDNVVGSVEVSAPAGGSVRGVVDVKADAVSNAGITSVLIETRAAPSGSFTPLCTDTTDPYLCAWDTTAITYGTFEIRAVATRGNGSTQTSAAVAVTVDNRVLGAGDVQVTDVLTAGSPAAGDKVTLTYTGLVDLSTVKAGWNGSSTPVTLSFKDKGAAGISSDALDFDANLGRVVFAQDYVKANRTVTFTGTMVATTSTAGNPVTIVTVTLGSTTGSANLNTVGAAQNAKELTWIPSTAVTDLSGTACTAASVLESGTNDGDF